MSFSAIPESILEEIGDFPIETMHMVIPDNQLNFLASVIREATVAESYATVALGSEIFNGLVGRESSHIEISEILFPEHSGKHCNVFSIEHV